MKAPGKYATPKELRELREERGLTQKQVAELCGVDERNVQRWEAGEVQRIRRVYLELIRKAKPAKR